MRRLPSYFERIRLKAQHRWEQLEADQELAGPWRLLFNQVQSPRHVLSELLQNADDAEATEVSVRIENGVFLFEHDGHDFMEEEFESLCRFGLSNKRRLLTIGFRGIGFRSVFSLGPSVEVITPSVACRFEKGRFTQPHWIDSAEDVSRTVIRVCLESPEKEQVLRSQIEQWSASALPLLFFQSIRRLRLPADEVRVEWIGPGPCTNSRRASLAGRECIVFQSAPEKFPPECLAEIRSERSEDIVLPPCEVLIVLGGAEDHRLYVVLPTDVALPLPFSCQAPFVQDPARTGIKDPAMSPTNTWLLKRIGALLGEKFQEWLGRQDLGLPDRARAYDLLPEISAPATGIASDVATRLVLDSFREKLGYANILLCADGSLGGRNYTARLPGVVLDVWSPETARVFFCPQKKKVLAREVSPSTRKRLASWSLLDPADHDQVLRALKDESRPPPRPTRLETLASLWSFAEQKTRGNWQWTDWWQTAAIVPVAGRDYLGRAKDILPSRGRPDQCSEDDWRFILDRAEVLDQEWNEMLAQLEADREAVKQRVQHAVGRSFSDEDAARLLSGFRQTKLGETTRLDQVFEQVAKKVFGKQPVDTGECIRLVHIAARLKVNISGTVPLLYLCQDGAWRGREDDLVCRSGLDLECLLPREWLNAHLISDLYERELDAAFVPKWREWLAAPERGGLATFALPRRKETQGWSLNPQFFQSRGVQTPPPRLKQGLFRFSDWDWDAVLWDRWKQLEKGSDAEVWREIAWGVVSSWSEVWQQRLTMDVRQEGYTHVYRIDDGKIPAAWIHALRGLPCLPDQLNRLHLPAELFRRTPDTLPLLDVEPFVHERWDTPEHEAALQALGVRTAPTDASFLIQRLKALSQVEDPPRGGLWDLYRAIERVVARLPADRSADLVLAFEQQALIRTESGWARRQFCFRENPDGIPGVSVIHRDFRDVLGLWERLKVRQQPALDDALEWLTSIPAAETLKEPEHSSVRKLLNFHPQEVWCRSSRWLNFTAVRKMGSARRITHSES